MANLLEDSKRNTLILYMSPLRPHADIVNYKLPDGSLVCGEQTNQAAVQYVSRQLEKKGQKLDRLFILASDKVRTEAVETKKNTSVTTSEFFHGWLREAYPLVEEVVYINVQDNMDELEQCKSMDEIARRLWPDRDTVYMDLTGGKRDTAMLMVTIMRLLQCEGIQTKQIVYSDFNAPMKGRVVDCTHLYNMMDKIDAMESFLRFGSATRLREVYTSEIKQYRRRHEDEPSWNEAPMLDTFTSVLSNMDAFSAHLTLCQAEYFERDIKNIMKSLREYQDGDPTKCPCEQVFWLIAPRVEAEFAGLLDNKEPTASIAEWCTRKNLLMQAFALLDDMLPKSILAAAGLTASKECKEMLATSEKVYKKEAPEMTLIKYCYRNVMSMGSNEQAALEKLETRLTNLRRRNEIQYHKNTRAIATAMVAHCSLRNTRNALFHPKASTKEITIAVALKQIKKLLEAYQNLLHAPSE